MKKMNIDKVHDNLTSKIKQYIYLILKEYSNYMNEDDINRLKSITDFNNILKIYD